MQDRLELPAELEKAFEQSKGLPSDAELAQKKVRDWDVVVKRGRRSVLWSRFKPVTALVATAAVVAMAVLLPLPGQDGSQSVLDQGQTAATNPDRGTIKQSVGKERAAIYKQQGYVLMVLKNEIGIDLIKDAEGIYAVKDGVKTKLLTLSKGQMHNVWLHESAGMPYLLLDIPLQPTDGQTDPGSHLHVVNTEDLTVKKLTTTGGLVVGKELVNNDSPQLVYLAIKAGKPGEALLMKQDLKTGQEQLLFRSNTPFSQLTRSGDSYVLNSGDEIVLVTDQGAKTIVRSERKEMTVYGLTEGSRILYASGLQNQYYEFNMVYTGKTRVMLYDIKQGESRPVLPNREGDQMLGFVSPGSGAIVVGNFVPDRGSDTKSSNFKGTSQLWNVIEGQEPRLMYERKTTWNERRVEWVGAAKNEHGYIFTPVHKQDFALYYDEAKGSVTDIDPKEVPNLLK